MKNLFLLSTDKTSSLLVIGDRLNLVQPKFYTPEYVKLHKYQSKHIYTTSDEEIKDGEYGICLNLVREGFKSNQAVFKMDSEQRQAMESLGGQKKAKVLKVVLTTDQELIDEGVQAIPDGFLEWFVYKTNDSGVPIDLVEVKKIYISSGKEDIFDLVCTACPSKYEIIIPNTDGWLSPMQKFKLRDDSKQTDWKDSTKSLMEAYGDKPEEFPYQKSETNLEKHLASVPEYKGERRSAFITKEKVLNEEAKRYSNKFANNKILTNDILDRQVMCEEAFESGAMWQQERSYSQNDMWEAYKASNTIFEDEIALRQEFEEWVEQFKKK